MKSRRDEAIAYFYEGYNCTQAVLLAHSDLLGVDTEQILKICQSFGGGMARLREVCGTVSAMFMIAGALTGSSDPKDAEGKKRNYVAVQKLAEDFRERNGSIICRTLLGLDGSRPDVVAASYREGSVPEPRTKEYYKKRPCPELIGDACDIIAANFSDGKTGGELSGADV